MLRWIVILSLLVTVKVLAQPLPAGITPQMIAAIKSMPPAQQAALAERYGIELGRQNPGTVSSSLGAEGEALMPEPSVVGAPPEWKIPGQNQENMPTDAVPKRFGQHLFDSEVSTFAPTDDAPVPNTYRLGIGDELLVQLFGKENDQFVIQIGRYGEASVPKLGPVSLAGLTFDDAKSLIRTRIEQQFIGVDAIVSMGRLRAIGIFIAGEVAVPGSYSVSGLTTVTQALFQAGGVSDIGSLRNIQVIRGEEIIATFDAYSLLLRGKADGDIRLQAGDVVFVPPYRGLAEVRGEVKRPMLYELSGSESVRDLLEMAGGFTHRAYAPTGILTRVADRGSLPVAVTLDLANSDDLDLPILDGDVLRVPEVGRQIAQSIEVVGAVTRPGQYGWRPGMRISDVFQDVRSDLLREADLTYSLIVSVKNELLDIDVQQFSLAKALTEPKTDSDPELSEFDKIVVFELPQLAEEDKENSLELRPSSEAAMIETLSSDITTVEEDYTRATLLEPILTKLELQARQGEPMQVVSVSGAVRAPGRYPLQKGLSVTGLIFAAGGLKDSAFTDRAELRRLMSHNGKVVTRYENVDLGQTSKSANDELLLQSRDHLMIREIPDWSPQDSVTVKGEVVFPGTYLIQKGEKLSDLIKRAGGLTGESFPEGSVFTREEVARKEAERARQFANDIRRSFASRLLTQEATNGSLVEVAAITDELESFEGAGRLLIDLPAALSGDRSADIELTDGDAIFIPEYNGAITVVGEVQQAGSHIYRETYSFQDYLGLSAGLTDRADQESMYIIRANGSVQLIQKSWWRFSGTSAVVKPGDTIVVPVNTQYQESIASWREITQIVYQSIVSVAAVARL